MPQAAAAMHRAPRRFAAAAATLYYHYSGIFADRAAAATITVCENLLHFSVSNCQGRLLPVRHSRKKYNEQLNKIFERKNEVSKVQWMVPKYSLT